MMEHEVREIVQEELSKIHPDEEKLREIAREEVIQAIGILGLTPTETKRSPFEVLLERAERMRQIADGVDALLVAAKNDPALANLLEEMTPHALF